MHVWQVGSAFLGRRVEELQPSLHVFGHTHFSWDATLDGVRYLMVEGGAQTASAFLAAGLVDRLLIYRAPILLGGGTPAVGHIGHDTLDKAFAQGLVLTERRQLGSDTLEIYERG